ncbi:response regulator [Legionella sp. CNM-4043-24]|uniref:response regulator n=1 Tax=Legionella sp. CNM-4043-24 TaxID=3421646 RepID=UPI00403B3653
MGNPWHILIVEDTLIAQKVIKQQLTDQGCVVDTASNGEEALKKAMTTRYDIILMDIGLGNGPDGFAVAEDIKKNSQVNSATPIMAVTAHGEPEYYHKAIFVGMEGYFNKPFTPGDALTIIEYLNSHNIRGLKSI